MSLTPIRRALLSVSDKSGLTEFALYLASQGVDLVSTGGTATALRSVVSSITEVAEITGFPEMLDGRVKTLHPKIYGGILGIRGNANHESAMAENNILPIDLVVVNLYPFEQALANQADFAACIENIDIGGPALIRAAAKNHAGVAVVVDPGDYEAVIQDMKTNNGAVSEDLRSILAGRAYARTAAYDSSISNWLRDQTDESFPHWMNFSGTKKQSLRYGENPHQAAALYVRTDQRPGVASADQIQGKALSYNNIADTDAAFELVNDFDEPAVAIVKHANPCGVAKADQVLTAYNKALACDPVSAFGGIVAVNQPIDAAVATAIIRIFTEVVIAPDASEEARKVLAKKKNLRVLLTGDLPDAMQASTTVRTVAGGYLVQTRDIGRVLPQDLNVVTKRAPTPKELEDLIFAFTVCKHVKSNAIVYAKSGATVGVGAGQMSRIDSARIAHSKSQETAQKSGGGEPETKGSVVASDAFFPFADGLLAAAAAGATAVIQPGGSIRDDEVIAAADDKNLAMILTGIRHFRH